MMQHHSEHQYAFNANGEWVNATKIEYTEHQLFFCECPQRHKMKLVKPSGVLGKRSFMDYFAHIVVPRPNNTNKRLKNTEFPMISMCSSGGESITHRNAKHKLRERVGSYFFATFKCQDCHAEVLQYTHDCTVSMEVVSDDKRWRYDCLLQKREGGGAVAAMEVFHKHASGVEKIQSVRESGLEIVEFRASDVLQMSDQGLTKLENIKVKIGKCLRCASMLTFSQLNQAEKAYYHSLESENKEITSQECTIENGYFREYNLKKAQMLCNVHEKCKALIEMSKDRLEIHLPQLNWNLCFNKVSKKINHGLLVSDFDIDIPTNEVCIFLVSDWDIENLHSIQWKQVNVERSFHVFLHCSTILRTLDSIEESQIVLKDCRWAILKSLEESHGLCAQCGRKGHTSMECRSKFCLRCGRHGHLKQNCFASKDVRDKRLYS